MRAAKAKTEIRREQIARAALELLARQGWQRVNLAAIARQVGVVPSAVYRHFRGKDQVLDAVLELVAQQFATNVERSLASSDHPIEQLHDLLRRHVALITSGVPVPRIILSEDVFKSNTPHRKKVQDIYRQYLGRIAAMVRVGQQRKLIARRCGPQTFAMMWLGLVQSPAILWLLSEGGFDLARHCEAAWSQFVHVLQPSS